MTESQHLQIILTISFSVIAGYTISAGIEYNLLFNWRPDGLL